MMTDAKAPLAETDLSQLQGLTLEDLDRLHSTQPAEAQSEPPAEDAQPDWVSEMQGPSIEKQLREALVINLGSEDLHLDQKDDLYQLNQALNKLFQNTLPESMLRLSQYLHAREQSNHLYDKLSELSSKRGAATEIIQTAKQIEQVEKVLQQDRPQAEKYQALDSQLSQLEQLTQRYRQIFALAQELN